MEILHIEDLTFRYPDAPRPALQNVSLSVSDGEFAVICGVSGCGKSTLLRLIKRELAPFGEKSGVIMYDGQPQEALDLRTECTGIGFVQQRPESQIVTDKVWHELAFGLESLGCDQKTMRARVAEMACYFGIQDWFHRDVDSLSGGQKQRVAIAGVMAMRPRCIILDEPTAMLDPNGRKEVLEAVRELNRKEKVTVILITHYMEEVIHADRVYVMDSGNVVMQGNPKEIFSQVDTLKAYGLDVPQVTLLAYELKKSGVDVPDGILTTEELVSALCQSN